MIFYNKLEYFEEMPHDQILPTKYTEDRLIKHIIQVYKSIIQNDPSCTKFRLIVQSKTHKAKLQAIIDKIVSNQIEAIHSLPH